MLQSLTIKEIEDLVNNQELDDKLTIALAKDNRVGVQKILHKAKKKQEQYLLSREKSEQMLSIENELWDKGYDIIGGIDEAGRGPLAGPVVSACVILPKGLMIDGVDDSKKLSNAKRQLLYDILQEKAIAIGVGIVARERIDEINIFNATVEAMQLAVTNCDIVPEYLLIDAMQLTEIPIHQLSIIGGDSKSQSIAAASIIAKVTRDRIMHTFSNTYPGYGFENHKGYGTKEHVEAIKRLGLTPIHRRSFTSKFA